MTAAVGVFTVVVVVVVVELLQLTSLYLILLIKRAVCVWFFLSFFSLFIINMSC